jgi:hypothetical protein
VGADGVEALVATTTIRPPGAKAIIEVWEIREIREIRGRIKKPNSGQWSEVRIWTTLFDARKHPAIEPLKVYCRA